MKTVTLKRVGFRMGGTALFCPWGGGRASIRMNESDILTEADELTKEQIHEGINDGGFGCERILGACLWIEELYENNYTNNTSFRTVNLTEDKEVDKILDEIFEIMFTTDV